MTTARGLAIPERQEGVQTIADLEQSFAIAVRQRELLEEYIQKRLTPGKHFYQVAGSKNSLTKEGAELICLPHGYRPSYFKEGGPDQPTEDDSPYQITVRCQLRKGESFAGEGIGSASSHVTKKDGQRVPRQPDPGLRHNATLKMAQKSAYIAATLNATAASEFFTQDIEDGTETAHEAANPVDAALLCPIHKTEWFKRGKMRNYAHPIGDTKVWCNREDVQKTKGPLGADDEVFPPETPQTAPTPQQGPAVAEPPPTFKSKGDLLTYALTLGLNKTQVLATLKGQGVDFEHDLNLESDLARAGAILSAVHGPGKKE